MAIFKQTVQSKIKYKGFIKLQLTEKLLAIVIVGGVHDGTTNSFSGR